MKIDIAIPELNVVADKYCQELECDGSSSILSYYMNEIGVQHQAYVGAVYLKTKKFEPHFWIEAGDYIIDFILMFFREVLNFKGMKVSK